VAGPQKNMKANKSLQHKRGGAPGSSRSRGLYVAAPAWLSGNFARAMSKRKLISAGALLILAILGCTPLSPPARPKVVGGALDSGDLSKILFLVRHDYVVRRVGKYYFAQHILWVEVHPDGLVEVFSGADKEQILNEGWVWSLRKNPNWLITGSAYWGSSNIAPAGIHVPPSL
jgi:hypothetical protein